MSAGEWYPFLFNSEASLASRCSWILDIVVFLFSELLIFSAFFSIFFDIMFYTDIICHSNVLLYAGNKKKQVERLRNRKITERKGLIHEYSIVST